VTGPYERPDFPYANPPAEPEQTVRPPYIHCQPQTAGTGIRIGDTVRSLVDDVNVSVGLTGLVVNVAPPRYQQPARARICWANDTVSMADATTFEVVAKKDAA
jgi:hypothetical protein